MTFVRLAVLIFWNMYAWSMGQMSASELNAFGKFISLSFFIAAPLLYFLPSIEGALRKQPNQTSIVLVNIFLGWTLIGWVVAIAWACSSRKKEDIKLEKTVVIHENKSPEQKPTSSPTDELIKLTELKEKGALSEEEFEALKAKILHS